MKTDQKNPVRALNFGDLLQVAYRAEPYPVLVKRPNLSNLNEYDRARVIDGGWFVFWAGTSCAWFRSFETCRINAFRPGVVAISHDKSDRRCFVATGGDYQGGAKQWQEIIPVEV